MPRKGLLLEISRQQGVCNVPLLRQGLMEAEYTSVSTPVPPLLRSFLQWSSRLL